MRKKKLKKRIKDLEQENDRLELYILELHKKLHPDVWVPKDHLLKWVHGSEVFNNNHE
jgi:hypothetical protein